MESFSKARSKPSTRTPIKPSTPPAKKDDKKAESPAQKAQREKQELLNKLGISPEGSPSASSEPISPNKWADQPNTGAQDAAIRTAIGSGANSKNAATLAANAVLKPIAQKLVSNAFANEDGTPPTPSLGLLALQYAANDPITTILGASSILGAIYKVIKTTSPSAGNTSNAGGYALAASALNPIENLAQGLTQTTPGNKLINWGSPENMIAAATDKATGMFSDIADNFDKVRNEGKNNYSNLLKPGAAQEKWNQRVEWSKERQKVIDRNSAQLEAKRIQDTMYSSPSYVAKLKEAGQDVKNPNFIGPPTPYENLVTTDADVAAVPWPKVFGAYPNSDEERRDVAVEQNRKKYTNEAHWWNPRSSNRENMPVDSKEVVRLYGKEKKEYMKPIMAEVPPELPTKNGLKSDGETPWFPKDIDELESEYDYDSRISNPDYETVFAASFVSANLAENLLKSFSVKKKLHKALIKRDVSSSPAPSSITPEDPTPKFKIGDPDPIQDYRPPAYTYVPPKLKARTLPQSGQKIMTPPVAEKVKIVQKKDGGFGTIFPKIKTSGDTPVGHSPEIPSPLPHVFEGENDDEWEELPKSTKLYDSSTSTNPVSGYLRYLSGKTKSGKPIWTERSIEDIVDEHTRKHRLKAVKSEVIPDLTISDLENATLESDVQPVYGEETTHKTKRFTRISMVKPSEVDEAKKIKAEEREFSDKSKAQAEPSGFPPGMIASGAMGTGYWRRGPERTSTNSRLTGSKRKMGTRGKPESNPDQETLTSLLDENGVVKFPLLYDLERNPVKPIDQLERLKSREELNDDIETIKATNDPAFLKTWLDNQRVSNHVFTSEDELKTIIYQESLFGAHRTKEKLWERVKSIVEKIQDPIRQNEMLSLMNIKQKGKDSEPSEEDVSIRGMSDQQRTDKIDELNKILKTASNPDQVLLLNNLIQKLETTVGEFDFDPNHVVDEGRNKYEKMVDHIFRPPAQYTFSTNAIMPLLRGKHRERLSLAIKQEQESLGGSASGINEISLWNPKRDSLSYSVGAKDLNQYTENYESIFADISNSQNVFGGADQRIKIQDSATGNLVSRKPPELQAFEKLLKDFWEKVFTQSTIRPNTFLDDNWLDPNSVLGLKKINDDFSIIVQQSPVNSDLNKYLEAIKNRRFRTSFEKMASTYSRIMAVKEIEKNLNASISRKANQIYGEQEKEYKLLSPQAQLQTRPYGSAEDRLTNQPAIRTTQQLSDDPDKSTTGLEEYAILMAKLKLSQIQSNAIIPPQQGFIPTKTKATTTDEFWLHTMFLVNRIANQDGLLKWAKYIPTGNTSASRILKLITLPKILSGTPTDVVNRATMMVPQSTHFDVHLAAVLSELAENLRKRKGIGYVSKESSSANPSKRDMNQIKYRMSSLPGKTMEETAGLIDPKINPAIIQMIRKMFSPNINIQDGDFSVAHNPQSGFKDLWIPLDKNAAPLFTLSETEAQNSEPTSPITDDQRLAIDNFDL